MEDSMCMLQIDDNNTITGYLMGYYKEYDEIRGYFLEEIVTLVGGRCQNLLSYWVCEILKKYKFHLPHDNFNGKP